MPSRPCTGGACVACKHHSATKLARCTLFTHHGSTLPILQPSTTNFGACYNNTNECGTCAARHVHLAGPNWRGPECKLTVVSPYRMPLAACSLRRRRALVTTSAITKMVISKMSATPPTMMPIKPPVPPIADVEKPVEELPLSELLPPPNSAVVVGGDADDSVATVDDSAVDSTSVIVPGPVICPSLDVLPPATAVAAPTGSANGLAPPSST